MLNLNFKSLICDDVAVLFDLLNKTDELMLVGGCVRNYVVNRKINDFDFATKLKPIEVISVLERNNIKYLTTGLKFGTVTAIINNNKYEITTLRYDLNTDGRHADIIYTDSYLEDAKRRDFTFNALYIDYLGNLYDYFYGLNDLKNGMIRFIGEPEKRIKEDYLRILRFFRFYSEYSLTLDYKSFSACVKYKNCIKSLSKERIKHEFIKIINGTYPIKVLKIMEQNGFIYEILSVNYLDLSNLDIFCSIKNFINFVPQNVFNLSLIISKNKIEHIKESLVLTNNELKFIELVNNYKDKIINENSVSNLFFNLKDKDLIKSIIVVSIINNNHEYYVEKINKYLNLLDNMKDIKLPINIDDLNSIGIFEQKKYGLYMNLAKSYFSESNFCCKKEDILKYLKKYSL